jgi:hypothetical protein
MQKRSANANYREKHFFGSLLREREEHIELRLANASA